MNGACPKHPDQKRFVKRQCSACYQVEWKAKRKWLAEHPEEAEEIERAKEAQKEANRVRRAEKMRERRAANLDFYRRYDRDRYQQPERRRSMKDRTLRRTYGISLAEYEDRRAQQQNRCAICETEQTTLAVDHDHATGAVRKLLCNRCNLDLSVVENWTANGFMKRALAYLEQHGFRKAD